MPATGDTFRATAASISAPGGVGFRLAAVVGALVLLVTMAAARMLADASVANVVLAGLAYTVMVAVVAHGVGAADARARFGLANTLTLVRGALNCAILGLLVVSDPAAVPTLWLVVTATVVSLTLDGIDGRLARRLGRVSRFGARFDVEMDALLLVGLALGIVVFDRLGPWVLLLAAARYVFLLAATAGAWLRAPLPASRLRKVVFVVQALSLIVAASPPVAPGIGAWGVLAALVAAAFSFARDVRWLWRRAG